MFLMCRMRIIGRKCVIPILAVNVKHNNTNRQRKPFLHITVGFDMSCFFRERVQISNHVISQCILTADSSKAG